MTNKSTNARFVVHVDDNFHYMEEDERYTHGEYKSYEEALAECKRIVDSSLDNLKNEMIAQGLMLSAESLYSRYQDFGDDPFIRSEPDRNNYFSAWKYAKEKSETLCSTQ